MTLNRGHDIFRAHVRTNKFLIMGPAQKTISLSEAILNFPLLYKKIPKYCFMKNKNNKHSLQRLFIVIMKQIHSFRMKKGYLCISLITHQLTFNF